MFTGAAYDQISKFFVSHWEESMAGQVGVKSYGREIQKGAQWGAGGIWRQREHVSLASCF
jgi:hypothetical protein